MSGSLGVVLNPCLLIVVVAALNKEVTTSEMYGWGFWVFIMSATLFSVVVCKPRATGNPARHPELSENPLPNYGHWRPMPLSPQWSSWPSG